MTRPTDTARSAALTALVVHLRDDEHMQWKQIAYRLHTSESSVMRRYERATTRARIAELERGHAELAQALAVAEERLKDCQLDADIDAILAMSDEDVLAEFKAEGGNIEALAPAMRDLFERVLAIVNARHADGR